MLRRQRKEREVIGYCRDGHQPERPQNREILEAFSQLPPAQQVAMDFFYIQGYKKREIAELLGIPIGTVKSRIERGLKKLKVILNEEN